jgi:hypothetical protein
MSGHPPRFTFQGSQICDKYEVGASASPTEVQFPGITNMRLGQVQVQGEYDGIPVIATKLNKVLVIIGSQLKDIFAFR